MASPYVAPVFAGLIAGLVIRAAAMVEDRNRRFPTHPHGEVVHLFLGFVAATLGALAVPALLTGNYTAGVFLGLGTSQFHSVRGLEANSLLRADRGDLVPRGPTYADGIALAFEARNFLVLAVALAATSLGVFLGWILGGVLGTVLGLGGMLYLRPTPLRSIADFTVREGEGGRGDPDVTVRTHARSLRAVAILRTPAQQQAILHDLHAGLGARLNGQHGEPILPQMAYTEKGELAVLLWPLVTDSARILEVASRIPVLEAVAAPFRE